MRIFLHIVLPLVIPILLYAIWAKIDAHRKGKGLPNWEEGYWFWVLIAGFIFMTLSLIYLTTLGGGIHGLYQSPTIENGNIIPGHFK